VFLVTFPKKGGGEWKFVFAGDSHDNSWDYIIENFKKEITNIDVLFAPHHGRDSKRNYDFLKTLTPSVTLMGNASSEHLAYSSYPETRITNNQAGYVVIDISEDRLFFLVKHKEFANNYRNKEKRKWGEANYYKQFDAYGLFQINAK
jgi:competence protein ComEC